MSNNAINMALTAIDSTERRAIAERYGVLDQVLEAWNGGKVCGQCRYFVQLGGRGSGLNGMCHVVPKNEYTRPGDAACKQFERVGDEG